MGKPGSATIAFDPVTGELDGGSTDQVEARAAAEARTRALEAERKGPRRRKS